jgi:hypothetical protein
MRSPGRGVRRGFSGSNRGEPATGEGMTPPHCLPSNTVCPDTIMKVGLTPDELRRKSVAGSEKRIRNPYFCLGTAILDELH